MGDDPGQRPDDDGDDGEVHDEDRGEESPVGEGASDAGERDAEEGDIQQQSQHRMNRDRGRVRRRGSEEADKTAEDQAREVERNLMSVHPRHSRLHAGPLLSDRPETMPIL